MSFNRTNTEAEALEEGLGPVQNYRDFPEFDNITEALDNSLYDVNNHHLVPIRSLLQQFQHLVDTGKEDSNSEKSRQLRSRLSSAFSKTTQKFKNIDRLTNNLNRFLLESESNREDQDTLKYFRQKESIVIGLIKRNIDTFKEQQQLYERLLNKSVRMAYDAAAQNGNGERSDQAAALEEPEGTQQSVQIEYEPINAEELEQQSLLIQEREREINHISQDIGEVNEIFQNLHNIVNEQQLNIDNIEDNIMRYSGDTHGASYQLRKAERYQRRSGGRLFCCLLILVSVLGSIVLLGIIF